MNYRPISLLCISFKLLDSWLIEKIRPYIERAGDHAQTQFGFRSHKSCAQQIFNLISLQEHCERNRVKRVVAFIDIKKAYDSVPRNKV